MSNTEKIVKLVSLAGETEGILDAAIFILEINYPKDKALKNMLLKARDRSDKEVSKIVLNN